MTDEELGRAWAERHGGLIPEFRKLWADVRDTEPGATGWSWWEDDCRTDSKAFVPEWLARIGYHWCGVLHRSEGEAYAALGSALRQLVAFADGVREVMGV